MTMEIEVTNKSTNYIGKVIEIDHSHDKTANVLGPETILKPGESKQFYVYDTRSIRIEEVEEITLKEAEPGDIPENESKE